MWFFFDDDDKQWWRQDGKFKCLNLNEQNQKIKKKYCRLWFVMMFIIDRWHCLSIVMSLSTLIHDYDHGWFGWMWIEIEKKEKEKLD